VLGPRADQSVHIRTCVVHRVPVVRFTARRILRAMADDGKESVAAFQLASHQGSAGEKEGGRGFDGAGHSQLPRAFVRSVCGSGASRAATAHDGRPWHHVPAVGHELARAKCTACLVTSPPLPAFWGMEQMLRSSLAATTTPSEPGTFARERQWTC
jgi:hypothetical protein